MNWYETKTKPHWLYHTTIWNKDMPKFVSYDEERNPSFDEWMAMIQGIEMWLEEVIAPPFDPTGLIPGWKVAIFKDASGTPYWRSDGRPLTDPQPEDLSLKNKGII